MRLALIALCAATALSAPADAKAKRHPMAGPTHQDGTGRPTTLPTPNWYIPSADSYYGRQDGAASGGHHGSHHGHHGHHGYSESHSHTSTSETSSSSEHVTTHQSHAEGHTQSGHAGHVTSGPFVPQPLHFVGPVVPDAPKAAAHKPPASKARPHRRPRGTAHRPAPRPPRHAPRPPAHVANDNPIVDRASLYGAEATGSRVEITKTVTESSHASSSRHSSGSYGAGPHGHHHHGHHGTHHGGASSHSSSSSSSSTWSAGSDGCGTRETTVRHPDGRVEVKRERECRPTGQ